MSFLGFMNESLSTESAYDTSESILICNGTVSVTVQDISVLGSAIPLGCAFLICCLVFFGLAVHFEWVEDLAPRVANRPKSIIKNAMVHQLTSKYKNQFWYYPIAWIIWSYNLTYKECLFGIPGTGTRSNGWEGPQLKTNLDAVVLMKFNTLLFKLSLMVAALCVFVLLPVNLTAECDSDTFGECSCDRHSVENVGFTKTTFANIPSKSFADETNTTLSANSIISALNPINDEASDEKFWVENQTWRVVMTMVCCLIIYVYTFYLLTKEWIENIALRRAFFLEASHHEQRIRELSKLECLKAEDESSEKKRVSTINELPAFVTHPEVRETPPSIGVYSVMYKLPNSMITYDTDGATAVERQLVATTKFFDQVVPPQPGYSSSVAAVTVIPNARLVNAAWSKWNACELKLQKLRYIRSLIASKKNEEKEASSEDMTVVTKDQENGQSSTPKQLSSESSTRSKQENDEDTGDEKNVSKEVDYHDPLLTQHSNGEIDLTISTKSAPIVGNDVESQRKYSSSMTKIFLYKNFDIKEYAKSLGFRDEVDSMSDLVDGMDVEEFHVFAYRAALLAGGPALNEKVLKMYTIGALEEEEADLMEELQGAREELLEARTNVITLDDDDEELQENEHSDAMLSKQNMSQGMGESDWFDSNEWGASAHEIEAMLPTSPTQSTERNRGIFGEISFALKRIFVGGDSSDFGPKYYHGETDQTGKPFVTDVDRPSYAVVTFTSRHSAITARQCLADGEALNRWQQVDDIPIFPLADAPPMLSHPRNLMKPVTPTISYTSKKIRVWLTYIFLIVFTTCYLVPIQLINTFLWDRNLEAYEDLFGKFGVSSEALNNIVPTLSGLTQTLLFSVCPTIFRFVAAKEGSSSSMDIAEQRSMIFFWYFYVAARFLGQLLWEFARKFASGEFSTVEDLVTDSLVLLARTVPSKLGPAALTLIIFSATITWPALYWLQMNNFLTSIFRLGWINRLLKGGGPGAEVPYRIYIDNGYVLACMTSLAPLCPLIGPFAMLYFIILCPMIRWLMVFGYRPRFDGGGDKWPKLHHIIVTSLLLSQVIVCVTFLLKGNLYEGLCIGFCIVPTLVYNSILLERFLRPFQDASLLYTGKLYTSESIRCNSMLEREEFRRWLVDCHKASYLPTCLSGGTTPLLTTEPAIVEPKSGDTQHEEEGKPHISRGSIHRQKAQKGGILRRQRYEL